MIGRDGSREPSLSSEEERERNPKMSTYKRKPQWALDLEERADLIQRSQALQERAREERIQKAQEDALTFLRSKLPPPPPQSRQSRRFQRFPERPTLRGWFWVIGALIAFLIAGVALGALLQEWGLLP